ncbi:MAG: carbohydrate ABC transporter permease, partial [Lachnospiraceae bacterium]|nr:carbohydrate ABC transporter permease [Lachnospiraceae bacterium]
MKTKKIKASRILTYVILIGGVLIAVFPFIWMILTSFKTNAEALSIPPTIFPEKINWEGYKHVLTGLPFVKIYLNTIISAVIIVTAQLVFCAMSGYAYARINFPFKNILFTLTLAVLMVPGTFFILPQYRIINRLGLLNTIPALFLPNLFSAMGTFLLRQFFLSLPQELEDAAYID